MSWPVKFQVDGEERAINEDFRASWERPEGGWVTLVVSPEGIVIDVQDNTDEIVATSRLDPEKFWLDPEGLEEMVNFWRGAS